MFSGIQCLFYLLIFASYPIAYFSVRDDLYDAVFVADVVAVRSLLSIEQGVLRHGRMDVDVNRRDQIYDRTNIMSCGLDPQIENSKMLDRNCRDIAKLLHEAGGNIFYIDPHGWDALHMGSVRGMARYCEYLLQSGVNVNRPDDDGRTSLMKAVAHGHRNATKILLINGADTNIQDNVGQTALHYATQLISKNSTYLPVLMTLLQHIADVDIPPDVDGRTALMHAVIGNAPIPVLKVLLAHGADPRLSDSFGVSLWAMSRSIEARNLLAESIANIAEREHEKWLLSSGQKDDL